MHSEQLGCITPTKPMLEMQALSHFQDIKNGYLCVDSFRHMKITPQMRACKKNHNKDKECLQQLTWDLTATCACFSMMWNICTFCTQLDVLVPWIWGTQGLWFPWPTNSHAKQRTCTAQQIPVFAFPPDSRARDLQLLCRLQGFSCRGCSQWVVSIKSKILLGRRVIEKKSLITIMNQVRCVPRRIQDTLVFKN